MRNVHAALRSLSGDHSPYRMPWLRTGRGSGPIDVVHRLSLELERSDAVGRTGHAILLGRALLWPLVSLLHALRMLGSHGGHVERTHGVGRLRQLVQMVACANLHNIDPESYYAYQLFRDGRRRWAGQILQPFEADRVGQEALRRVPVNEIDPKIPFYRRCRRLGLPTAPVTATFLHGEPGEWLEGEKGHLPPVDLLLKPCDGASGLGVEAWRRDAGAAIWRRRGVELSEADLLDRCRTLSMQEPYLVQPRLENHPALAALSSGALCTVRTVTCFPLDGPPVELLSVLRMPVGETDADNFNIGGIVAPVDPETGRLGPAMARDLRRGTWDRHPDTGAPIAGTELPGYAEIVELCLAAHARFPEHRSIGWDVPVTPDGPLLLEGNALWGVEMMQMAHGRPLGPTLAPECLLEGLA
jgi:hypothetical protein